MTSSRNCLRGSRRDLPAAVTGTTSKTLPCKRNWATEPERKRSRISSAQGGIDPFMRWLQEVGVLEGEAPSEPRPGKALPRLGRSLALQEWNRGGTSCTLLDRNRGGDDGRGFGQEIFNIAVH